MAATCECNNTLGNLGTPTCYPLFKVARRLIFVPTYDNTGALNKIDVTVALTQSVIDAHVNETDLSKRWYISPVLQNATGERSDPVIDESPSGDKDFVKDGVRTMAGEFRKQAGVFIKELTKLRCNEFSIYVIDLNGSLRGIVTDPKDGSLYPIKADNDSFVAKLFDGTDSTVPRVDFTFDWKQTELDENINMIAAADIPGDLLNTKGLIAVVSTITVPLVAGFTAKLEFNYGSLANPIKDSGLLITDFFDVAGGSASNVYNVTDAAAEPLSSVTETAVGSGIYVFVYTTPVTIADVIRLTPVKDGRDYSAVILNTFVTA
ncbi:MAG: hypothetical protein ACUZ8H_16065 [Candidatus Anammoxibacter sp.]